MRSKFWYGMLLGTLATTAISAFIGPLNTPLKKPLVERSAEAVQVTAHDFVKKARRAQRRMMKRF